MSQKKYTKKQIEDEGLFVYDEKSKQEAKKQSIPIKKISLILGVHFLIGIAILFLEAISTILWIFVALLAVSYDPLPQMFSIVAITAPPFFIGLILALLAVSTKTQFVKSDAKIIGKILTLTYGIFFFLILLIFVPSLGLSNILGIIIIYTLISYYYIKFFITNSTR